MWPPVQQTFAAVIGGAGDAQHLGRGRARFSRSDASCRTPCLAGCITNTSEPRFSERTVDGTDFRDMGALLVLLNPRKYLTSCRAGARPGHPITGRCGCIVAV